MGDERPSDAAQPQTKRRAGAQLTKDEEEEEDDTGLDPGEWRPVDGATAQRRRVKVRRRGEEPEPTPAAVTAPAAGDAPAAAAAPSGAANPFAGISLTAPAANPFAGISLMAPSTSTPAAGDKPAAAAPAEADTKEGDKAPAEKEQGEQQKGEEKPESKAATPAASGFGALAASAKPFGSASAAGTPGGFASVTGAAFGTNTGGFGGFGPGSSGTPLFGGSSTTSFSFGTGAFPNIAAAPLGAAGSMGGAAPSGNADEEGGEGGEALQLFNSTAEFTPVVQLPDQKLVTGEEEESSLLTVDGGALYEFDAADRKWRERGKGEFKINTNKEGQARMVMRAAGNFRLLLNATVYKGMPVSIMAGNSGVTFACINAASATDGADKKEASSSAPASAKKVEKEGAGEGGGAPSRTPGLATWGLKIKPLEKMEAVFQMLQEYAKNAKSSNAAGGDVEAGAA